MIHQGNMEEEEICENPKCIRAEQEITVRECVKEGEKLLKASIS